MGRSYSSKSDAKTSTCFFILDIDIWLNPLFFRSKVILSEQEIYIDKYADLGWYENATDEDIQENRTF
ncbi:hypothetical protein D3C74_313330 [compost metagenome]